MSGKRYAVSCGVIVDMQVLGSGELAECLDAFECKRLVSQANAAIDLAVALEDTVKYAHHADGCEWWDTSALKMGDEYKHLEAEVACKCFLQRARAALEAYRKAGE